MYLLCLPGSLTIKEINFSFYMFFFSWKSLNLCFENFKMIIFLKRTPASCISTGKGRFQDIVKKYLIFDFINVINNNGFVFCFFSHLKQVMITRLLLLELMINFSRLCVRYKKSFFYCQLVVRFLMVDNSNKIGAVSNNETVFNKNLLNSLTKKQRTLFWI